MCCAASTLCVVPVLLQMFMQVLFSLDYDSLIPCRSRRKVLAQECHTSYFTALQMIHTQLFKSHKIVHLWAWVRELGSDSYTRLCGPYSLQQDSYKTKTISKTDCFVTQTLLSAD